MTDNDAWQPPSDPAFAPPSAPFAPPAPQFAAPAAPQFAPPVAPQFAPPGAPQFAPPGTASGTAPGTAPGAAWAPPPKPGLIPLRPLGFGTILGAAFTVIRRNPRPTFGISLAFNGIITLLFGLIFAGFIFFSYGRLTTASGDDAATIFAGTVGLLLLTTLIPVAFSTLVGAIVQGIISLEVSRGTIGEKLTTRGLWRLAKGRMGALIGWSAILAGATIIALIVVVVAVTAIITFGGSVGIVVGILLAVFAGLVALVLYAWIGTKIALVPSVLMLERLPLRQAVARSWSLTTGYFWKTLGTLLLVNVIINVASQVVTTPISLLASVGVGIINPNGDEAAAVWLLGAVSILTAIVSIVFSALTSVTQSSVASLIYIDIRMRREGLDLDLARFVEARQVGTAGVGNPYLPHSAPPTTTAWA